jgi:hypothetical protein
MAKAVVGALVKYCGHDAVFIADIDEVSGANVVRANGPISDKLLVRHAANATHHLVDYPNSGFWRPDLGVFVVPKGQVREL